MGTKKNNTSTGNMTTTMGIVESTFDVSLLCQNCASLMERIKVFSKDLYKCSKCGRSFPVEK